MMAGFKTAFDEIVLIEGGYSDRKNDRGGKTKFGVTESVARAHGYQGDMADMPIDVAMAIAKAQYWDILRLDEIDAMAPKIAFELFDTGYNAGVGTAGKMLQRCLNALNRQQVDFPDMAADGVVGPMTVSSLRSYLAKRSIDGDVVLLRALNCLQGERYISIAEIDKTQEDNLYGWLRNRVST